MASRIIDIHTHLGDILYPNGGRIIEQTGVKSRLLFDPLTFFERRLWREIWIPRVVCDWIIKAGAARNFIATRENLRREMDKFHVQKAAVLAVPPYVTFDDLHAAYQQDPDMLPFTGVDYALIEDIDAIFAHDVARGAAGLKLHPILQLRSLKSAETMAAVEAWAVHDKPVLFHAGKADYYFHPSELHKQEPEFGRIDDAIPLVKAFPNVNFICGHAGLDAFNYVIGLLAQFPNVSIDISFQSPENVQKLLEAFGPERVMYGSDWPWGNMQPSISVVKAVCKGDRHLEARLFYENAAEILRLSEPELSAA